MNLDQAAFKECLDPDPLQRRQPFECHSVVQRAEIEWGGVAARHAPGRFALNLVLVANASNSIR